MFKEFGHLKRWIVYRRADKVPVRPDTLENLDAQNPENWQTGTYCQQWATHLGPEFGIGYVIWEDSGVACIDIDKAWDGKNWSRLANEMCDRFKGAYIEVSQGGAGLHIFFSYKNLAPAHRSKNTAAHIELYTEKRFIGITGTHASGSALFDGSDLLPRLVGDYFPPAPEFSSGEWTSGPNSKWNGPTDDEALLHKAMASRSTLGVFKGKASFADLFTGNVDVLARVFPGQSTGKVYDASSADQALANHCAFWTGGDCERMERIMQRSELKREKWEDRPGYLKNTILNSCGWQKEYFNQRAASADVVPVPIVEPLIEVTYQPATVVSADGTVVELPPNEAPKAAAPCTEPGNIIATAGQAVIFKGCLWVTDINEIMVPDGRTFEKSQFDNRKEYARRSYIFDTEGKTVESAWEAFVQGRTAIFPQVDSTVFEPRSVPGAIIQRDGLDYVNTWKDIDIAAAPGDPAPFVSHIKRLFPNGEDAEIYLSYIAACVQYRGVKAAWALFVQGVPGNGKSFLTKVLNYCLGDIYVHSASASNLDNNFNGYLYRKLLICVEEVMTTEGKAATWEKLKTMITELRQEIESKGVDQITREVCYNMIFNSNHKDGLRKTADDRRVCPLYCAQQSVEDLDRDGMDEAYFIKLWDWFNADGAAIVLDFLRTYPIQDRLNFAKGARRAPRTSSTDEAISAGLGSVEQDIMECVKSSRPGFRNGWINSGSLDMFLKEGKGKFIARNKRVEMLRALGYVKHPGLADGRLNNPLTDGSKPTLYVRRDSPAVSLKDHAMIKNLYEQQQKD